MGNSGDTVFVVRMILIKLCIIILAGLPVIFSWGSVGLPVVCGSSAEGLVSAPLPGVDVPFAGVWLTVPAGVALGLGLSGNATLSCVVPDVLFSDVGRVLWHERQLVSFVGSGWSRGLPVPDPCFEADGGLVRSPGFGVLC